MNNKFKIGDLITSSHQIDLAIILAKSDRSFFTSEPIWYYFVRFCNGKTAWLHEATIKLEARP